MNGEPTPNQSLSTIVAFAFASHLHLLSYIRAHSLQISNNPAQISYIFLLVLIEIGPSISSFAAVIVLMIMLLEIVYLAIILLMIMVVGMAVVHLEMGLFWDSEQQLCIILC